MGSIVPGAGAVPGAGRLRRWGFGGGKRGARHLGSPESRESRKEIRGKKMR